jgi:threonine dehydrogenase-like Zn-dependent dehydrogenase
MKAVTYHGPRDIRVETVPDPKIQDPNDVILRVTKSAICGSDLHFYRGHVTIDDGFIVGHEFMGIIEDVGKGVKLFKNGDRVVAPFWVSCGVCPNCRNGVPTSCTGGGGCFGFGKAFGDFSGGQAEYVRVPFADTTLESVPGGIEDDRVLFLGDILSTGYFCAEWANIKPGDTVAIFGDGPLGLFATASARLFGPSQIITVFVQPVAIPMLDFYLKDLTLRGGVCPAKNYISKLMPLVEKGKLDPTAVITHDLKLGDTPNGYKLMDSKDENAIKVVLTP